MGTLLHLSDLHLADATAKIDVTGDYKVDALPLEDRQRRTSTIRNTLRQLGRALERAEVALDAIVISGDVTVQGQPNGFDLLPKVLDELATAKPPNERILIVPGNHDVVWGTKPGMRDRYENFLKLRAHGYKTAYLDGVDIDRNGNLQNQDNSPPDPYIVAHDSSFIVIGINSANHCGVESDLTWATFLLPD
jgi:3',5'-cyclic AMP phosphodiesterase CpdA